jgi:hypothetical protein
MLSLLSVASAPLAVLLPLPPPTPPTSTPPPTPPPTPLLLLAPLALPGNALGGRPLQSPPPRPAAVRTEAEGEGGAAESEPATRSGLQAFTPVSPVRRPERFR